MRDIPRTYPELEFFKDGGRGQQALFNVIKAYSIHDKEVGYCQGSAFIVGQLLLQVSRTGHSSIGMLLKSFLATLIDKLYLSSCMQLTANNHSLIVSK